ncbi:MAG: hypothetical protein HFI14_05580 [Lachnospiraceae bacterium]|nr:hypothetical protein [Lachnospiraceae bacterium]
MGERVSGEAEAVGETALLSGRVRNRAPLLENGKIKFLTRGRILGMISMLSYCFTMVE